MDAWAKSEMGAPGMGYIILERSGEGLLGRGPIANNLTPAEIAAILERQLAHFQPEGLHAPVRAGDDPYGRLLPAIRGLRLRVTDDVGNYGEDRMGVWVKAPDPQNHPGWPQSLGASVESVTGGALVDLDGHPEFLQILCAGRYRNQSAQQLLLIVVWLYFPIEKLFMVIDPCGCDTAPDGDFLLRVHVHHESNLELLQGRVEIRPDDFVNGTYTVEQLGRQ